MVAYDSCYSALYYTTYCFFAALTHTLSYRAGFHRTCWPTAIGIVSKERKSEIQSPIAYDSPPALSIGGVLLYENRKMVGVTL